ncbi:hypothetical protein FSHL1_004827 [Fusarium sambucinum]
MGGMMCLSPVVLQDHYTSSHKGLGRPRMERRESCDLFLSNVMFDPDIDIPSVSWSGFSLSPADDALFADVYLGTDEDSFSMCTFSTDLSTFNFDRTFVHENYLPDISLTSWDFLTMQPPLTTNPSTESLTSPDNGEPPECVETQTSSLRPMTQVSLGMLSPRMHEVLPTQNTPERPAGIPNTPSGRTKMKHGTRPFIAEDRSEKRTNQTSAVSAKRAINGGVIWKGTTALNTQKKLPRWGLARSFDAAFEEEAWRLRGTLYVSSVQFHGDGFIMAFIVIFQILVQTLGSVHSFS